MSTHWTLARRATKMNPSVIREITEKPGVISLAGGLPSPKTFPIEAFAAASERVLRMDALQAFAPMEPDTVGVGSDGDGVNLDDLTAKADGARFFCVLLSFQSPTGRCMSEVRREALAQQASALGLPIVEDNPYGDLWFESPPPAPLTARDPAGCIYLGSFSKVLAPGLRLGHLVAPTSVFPKLRQAKQAADLRSPGDNQGMVPEVLKDGFLENHVPTIQALYKAQCQAMLAALDAEMQGLGVEWHSPAGGIFLWLRLPEDMTANDLLSHAIEHGVAFVPGNAFYAEQPDPRTLRLSFATASEDQIRTGIAALAGAVRSMVVVNAMETV